MAAGIYSTNDSGATWTYLDTSSFDINNLKDLYITKEGELQLLGDNGVFNLDETMVPLTNKTSVIDKFQTKKIDGYFIITNKDKEVYRIASSSPDYYFTSSEIDATEDLSADFSIIKCSDDGMLLYGVSGNRLYESIDAGLTWTYQIIGTLPLKSISISDFANYIYLSDETNTLYVRSISNLTSAILSAPENFHIKSISCSKSGEKVILAVEDGNNNYLFISNDYGETFSSSSVPYHSGYIINKVVCTHEGNYIAFSLVNSGIGESILYYYNGTTFYNRDTFVGIYGDITYDNKRESGWEVEAPTSEDDVQTNRLSISGFTPFRTSLYTSAPLAIAYFCEYNGYIYSVEAAGTTTSYSIKRLTNERKLYTSITANVYESQYVFATEYDGYIWRSSDGGITWTAVLTDQKRKWKNVASYGNYNTAYVFATEYDGYIWKSYDSGVTWTAILTDQKRKWNEITNYNSYQYIIAAEYDGYIWTSSNGGTTWTSVLTDQKRKWSRVAVYGNNQYIIAAEYDGYIWTSSNGGTTWTTNSNSSGIGKWTMLDNPITDISGEIYAGTFDGKLVKTSNFGVSWQTVSTSNYRYYGRAGSLVPKGQINYIKLLPIYGNSLLIDGVFYKVNYFNFYSNCHKTTSYDGSVIYSKDRRSLDGGITWSSNTVFEHEYNAYFDGLKTTNYIGDVVYCSVAWKWGTTLYSNILKSTDFGNSWTLIFGSTSSSNSNQVQAISTNSTGDILVFATGYWSGSSYSGNLYKSIDGGQTLTGLISTTNYKITGCDISDDGQIIVYTGLGQGSTSFISYDGGTTWTPIYIDKYGSATGPVVLSDDGQTIYVGGQYVLSKSINSGLTWDPCLKLRTTVNVSGIAGDTNFTRTIATGLLDVWIKNISGAWSYSDDFSFEPTYLAASNDTGSNLAVARTYSGISLSSDYGDTWLANNALETKSEWNDITTNSSGTRMAAVPKGTGFIYISTDSGSTWSAKMTDKPKAWISISSSGSGQYIYATSQNQIFKSSDYGDTWENIKNISTGNKSIVKTSFSGEIIIHCTSNSVYKSEDYGVSWETILYNTSLQIQDMDISSDASSIFLALLSAVNSNGIWYSKDSGSTWNYSGGAAGFLSISSSSNGTKIYAKLNGSGLYVSTDGGASWTARGFFTALDVACNSTGAIAYATRGYDIAYSTDSGVTWNSLGGSTTEDRYNKIETNDAGSYIIVSTNTTGNIFNGLYVSINSGSTWSPKIISKNLNLIFLKENNSGSVIYAADSYHLWVSTNYGSTWTRKNLPVKMFSPLSYNESRIVINSTGDTIYLVDNFDIVVYKSTNYGSTWTRITVGSYSLKAVICDSTGTNIACCNTNYEFYVSTNSGGSFSKISSLISIWNLACSSDFSIIYACTNTTLFKSTNQGVSWSAITAAVSPKYLWVSNSGTSIYYTVIGGACYYSTNSGSTFFQLTELVENTTTQQLLCDASGDKAILVNNYIHMTENTGVNWVKVFNDKSGNAIISRDGNLVKLFINNTVADGNVYTYRGEPNLYFSKNDGIHKSTTKDVTLFPVISGTTGGETNINCGYLDTLSYFKNERMYLSDDQVTWSNVELPVFSSLAISKRTNSSNVIFYTNNKYIYSYDIYNNIFDNSNPKNNDLMRNSSNGSKIACDTLGTNIYIYDNSGNLYKSNNSGISFSKINFIADNALPGNVGRCENLVCSSNGTVLVMTIESIYSGLYYLWVSVDSGLTFTKITARNYKYVSIDSTGTKMYACDNSGYIHYSGDYGTSWSQLTNSGARSWSSIATNYTDGTAVVASTNGSYVYKSYDSGATWTNDIKYGTGSWKKVLISADGTNFIATATAMDGTSVLEDLHGNFDLSILEEDSHNGSTMYYSKTYFCGVNGDYSFVINHSKTSSPYFTTCNYVGDKIFIHHNSYENTLFSVGGFSEKVSSIHLEDKNLSAINYLTSDKIYYSTYNGEVYNQADVDLTSYKTGNKTWSTVATNYLGDVVAAAADGEYIRVSRDYGEIYEKVLDLGTNTWSCSAVNNDGSSIIVCEKNGAMHKGTYSSGSYSWSTLTSAGSREWVSISTNSTGNWIAACVNNGYIYVSSNGGTTWTAYMNDSVRDWKDIKIRTNNNYQTIVACTSTQIFSSSDGGTTWNDITDGLSLTFEKISFDYINQLDSNISVIAAASNNNLYIKEQSLAWDTLTTGKTYTNAARVEISYTAGTQTYLIFLATNEDSFIGISYNNNQTWSEIKFGNYDKLSTLGWISACISGNFNTIVAAHSSTEYDSNLVVIRKIDTTNSNSNENTTSKTLYVRNLFKTEDENYTWKYVTVDDVTLVNDDSDVISELPTSEVFWNTTIPEAPGHWYDSINTKRIVSAISKSQTINNEFKYYIINCLENDKKVGNNKNGFFIMHEDGSLEVLISNIEIYSLTQQHSTMSTNPSDYTYSGTIERAFPVAFADKTISFEVSSIYGKVNVIYFDENKMILESETISQVKDICSIRAVGRWKK